VFPNATSFYYSDTIRYFPLFLELLIERAQENGPIYGKVLGAAAGN